MTDSMLVTITDLYCEGISEPIPYAGTAEELERRLAKINEDRSRYSVSGKLRWDVDGRHVVLDLNKTNIVAMVERRVPAP